MKHCKHAMIIVCLVAATSIASAQGMDEPPPAFKALMGTDLERLVRHHAVLNTVCNNHSLDTKFEGTSMRLQIRELKALDALGDLQHSNQLAWLLNAYYVAYGSGVEPGVALLEKKSPGTKARICATFEEQAKELLQ